MFFAKPLPKAPKAKILEINLISAQDLVDSSSRKTSSSMETYVVAYIDAEQKLVSRLNTTGDTNPTWNDKFIFLVEEEFLSSRPNASVVFEIYQTRPKKKKPFYKKERKDKKIGVVHVLLDDLLHKKESACGEGSFRGIGDRCLAFHVRDSSGEPQGILNIGAVSLDCVFDGDFPNFLGSIPAVDHRKLTGSP